MDEIHNSKIENSLVSVVILNYNDVNYIEKCFNIALKLIGKGISYKLINGPISKKHFLQKKFLGVTEYLAKKTNTKKANTYAYNNFNQSLYSNLSTKELYRKKYSKKALKRIRHKPTKKFKSAKVRPRTLVL